MEHLASQPPQDMLEDEGVYDANNQRKLQSHVHAALIKEPFIISSLSISFLSVKCDY